MNKGNRKRVNEVVDVLETTKDKLEDILDCESEKMNNYPENLQGTEAYEAIELACDNIERAVGLTEEIIELLEEVV